MSNYRPTIDSPIPLVLLTPVHEKARGVIKKNYKTIEEALAELDGKGNCINLFFGSFKTYGGTEEVINGVYSITDTAIIETWYRPDIKANCRIARANDKAIFDIINEPENINMRNQFLKLKVKRVKGGV